MSNGTGLAIVHTRARVGIDAPPVSVEVHISSGLPGWSMVGLPETTVRESKERVRSAIINSGYDFPPRRITVNLAPADLPKDGGRFDLALALGILAASGQIEPGSLEGKEFFAELALSGELRPVKGLLPAAVAATESGHEIFVSKENRNEACLPGKVVAYAASRLMEVCQHLSSNHKLKVATPDKETCNEIIYPDFADVKGQVKAKRTLEIAASGNHSLLMNGPPGTGKTMLASRLPGILPPLTEKEAMETAAIYSINGQNVLDGNWRQRKFRAPHHTVSSVALAGGGSNPKPGEISLAHNGVLFLDELPEFSRHALEIMREPLESGHVLISRAARQVQFPASFQLIAAMNPCPCGFLGDPSRNRCGAYCNKAEKYRAKISGPLMDRIDLHIEVPALEKGFLTKQQDAPEETSREIRQRVNKALNFQLERQGKPNSKLTQQELGKYCRINSKQQGMLEHAIEKLKLSARAYHRILKIARTIADMEQIQDLKEEHILEAINYRKSASYFP